MRLFVPVPCTLAIVIIISPTSKDFIPRPYRGFAFFTHWDLCPPEPDEFLFQNIFQPTLLHFERSDKVMTREMFSTVLNSMYR